LHSASAAVTISRMDEYEPPKHAPVARPTARFYVVAFAALAFLLLGIALTAQETDRAVAGVSTLIGILGMLACAWMLRGGREP
jgi:hypothetical protein